MVIWGFDWSPKIYGRVYGDNLKRIILVTSGTLLALYSVFPFGVVVAEISAAGIPYELVLLCCTQHGEICCIMHGILFGVRADIYVKICEAQSGKNHYIRN